MFFSFAGLLFNVAMVRYQTESLIEEAQMSMGWSNLANSLFPVISPTMIVQPLF